MILIIRKRRYTFLPFVAETIRLIADRGLNPSFLPPLTNAGGVVHYASSLVNVVFAAYTE